MTLFLDRSMATPSRAFNRLRYRLGNRVERFFNTLRQSRRIATKYGKLAARDLPMVKSAITRLWLDVQESMA